MPRPIWSGSISFGLVNVPVKLFTAQSSKDVHFNQLHSTDNSRVRMKRFCELENIEIQYTHSEPQPHVMGRFQYSNTT